MEQMIGKYTYWGGIALAAIAFLLRAAHGMGYYLSEYVGRVFVSPSNLVEGAVLLLVASMATAHYTAHFKKS